MRYIYLTTIFSAVFAYEKDMTFPVQPGKTECFYQQVAVNDVIDIEYQVIDTSRGDLAISFQLADPQQRIIVADYKKTENSHRHTSTQPGDYRFCFDNSFSTFATKTVFFDILIQTDDDINRDYDYEDKEMELGDPAESYMMRVRDISESVTKVRDNIAAAKRIQDLHSAHEARERNLAEGVCSRVQTTCILHIVSVVFVGVTQVLFVKRLFEDARSNKLDHLMSKFSR